MEAMDGWSERRENWRMSGTGAGEGCEKRWHLSTKCDGADEDLWKEEEKKNHFEMVVPSREQTSEKKRGTWMKDQSACLKTRWESERHCGKFELFAIFKCSVRYVTDSSALCLHSESRASSRISMLDWSANGEHEHLSLSAGVLLVLLAEEAEARAQTRQEVWHSEHLSLARM